MRPGKLVGRIGADLLGRIGRLKIDLGLDQD